MKKFILSTLIILLAACTSYAQIIYNTGGAPKKKTTAPSPYAKAGAFPDITFAWQPATVNGLTMPSTFSMWSYHNNMFATDVALTFGLAKIKGAGDVQITVKQKGDTIKNLKLGWYWGYGFYAGGSLMLNTILDQYGIPVSNTVKPTLVFCFVGGVDKYAITAGVDALSRDPLSNKWAPLIKVGATTNLTDIFKRSLIVIAKPITP